MGSLRMAHVLFSLGVMLAEGRAFLGPSGSTAGLPELDGALRRSLLAEIEEALGSAQRELTQRRLAGIEAVMQPTFAALPKNERGRLAQPTVRYAMHRFFLKRHGWSIRGLEPAGDAWNASSPAAVLQEQLPKQVENLFEKRVGGRGLDLHELAVMASLLENLVHEETQQRLVRTYHALDRAPTESLSVNGSFEVIDAYMAGYILGFNFSAMTPSEMQSRRERIEESYPAWPETQTFLRGVQAEKSLVRDNVTFSDVSIVVEEIADRYGHWQDMECRALKDDLVRIEGAGTGRVRLADFYSSAVNDGKWQFSESVDYLRQLGALDESEPSNMQVIIANYISSPSNCVASSSYYSVCCLDECEELLGQLEEQLHAPHATSKELAARVARLPSASVPGNRTLPRALLDRLEEVAQHHQGRIPLHGRLFAQWMHLAYPRECPFPHVTGTTAPQRAEDWIANSGQSVSASEEEMLQHIQSKPQRSRGPQKVDEAPQCTMWTMEEELVAAHLHGDQLSGPSAAGHPAAAAALHGAALAAAVVSVTLALARACTSALASEMRGQSDKQAVHYNL